MSTEKAERDNETLRAELAWYGEQARLARLIHSEGDAGRNALQADGGKRARAALASDQAEPEALPAIVGKDAEVEELDRLYEQAAKTADDVTLPPHVREIAVYDANDLEYQGAMLPADRRAIQSETKA